MSDLSDDFYGRTAMGQLALQKLGPVPENFRIYLAGWIGKKPEDWKEMEFVGAEFRRPVKGQFKGKLCVPIPHSRRAVRLTREELAACAPQQ